MNMKTEEQLKAMNLEELKAEKQAVVTEGNKLIDENKLDEAEKLVEYGKLVQSIIDTKKEEQPEVKPDAVTTAKPEEVRNELKALEQRSMVTRALNNGVTTSDIAIQEVAGDVETLDVFKITEHVTINEQENALGKLPTLKVNDSMNKVDELAENPSLAVGQIPLEANPFDCLTYRKSLVFSGELLSDALQENASNYISSIASGVTENTKLNAITKAIEEAKPVVTFDKASFMTALGELNNGTAQLLANKANIIKVIDAVGGETIVQANEMYLVISGIKVKVIELPKEETAVLLFNRENVELVQSKRSPDAFRIIDRQDMATSSNVGSFYAKALVITSRFDVVLTDSATSFELA